MGLLKKELSRPQTSQVETASSNVSPIDINYYQGLLLSKQKNVSHVVLNERRL